MNKQSALALFIAPFLFIGGYIASDQYVAHQNNKGQLYNLTLEKECYLFSGHCILKSGDMLINITDDQGYIKVNTSFPVDKVTVSTVSTDNTEIIYVLNKAANFQYWQRETALRMTHLDQRLLKSLRILVKIKGDLYLAELSAVALKG